MDIGIGATRGEERIMAATGLLSEASTVFEPHNNVMNAGVLFSLPALLSQGLLKATSIYEPLPKGFYSFVHILLLLAFMALSRIKNPEQLKKSPPGELGKVLGLDRVPEAKCLREKLSLIVSQQKAENFERTLSKEWITSEECLFFYIDGHVRVYHGYQANLSKKFVSRQKLCLPGTTEYWVNDEKGLPFMVFTGQLNEKLKEAIENIVPSLIEDTRTVVDEKALSEDPDMPRFTIVFDREAYEPAFFAKLWAEYRIAIITYRKNVKDAWNENDFYKIETKVINNNVSMLICEKQVALSDYIFREIRKLGNNGHQTSMVTTNKKIGTAQVAGKMFSRWSQENFFRYLIQEYDFDKIIQYGIEPLNQELTVVNPQYSQLSYKLKKAKEKKLRIDARLLELIENNIDANISQTGQYIKKQAILKEKQTDLEMQIQQIIEQRASKPSRIKIKDMPTGTQYNKLKYESKLFMNTIKMIAYRAETILTSMISQYYKNAENEGRQLVQEIMQSDADLNPNYNDNTLTIVLHSLSTPRANKAAEKLCAQLNDTQTIYPKTCLKLIFKTFYNDFATGQKS
jgi:hypothetical protein